MDVIRNRVGPVIGFAIKIVVARHAFMANAPKLGNACNHLAARVDDRRTETSGRRSGVTRCHSTANHPRTLQEFRVDSGRTAIPKRR